MPTRRVALESITARLLWDGRAEDGRFIPGVAHFDAGVRALRGAPPDVGKGRLREIDETLGRAEEAVNRWVVGLREFARVALDCADDGSPGWDDGGQRRLRIRTVEAARLADLVVAFDAACAATAAVTATARCRGVFNPHHASIRDRARMIRRIVDLGYAGGRAVRAGRGGRCEGDRQGRPLAGR
ncbi:MAG: hypothetical protein OXH15_09980 [Gammaproteobacteria bacterium]|nr:hypothetical protein [Gammaproteobacteria bacterium]